MGINPLLSIMHEARRLKDAGRLPLTKVSLLYSAKSSAELLFKDDIEALCGDTGDCFGADFFVTGSEDGFQAGRRIGRDDLEVDTNLCLLFCQFLVNFPSVGLIDRSEFADHLLLPLRPSLADQGR